MTALDEKPGCIDPNQPHSDCLSVSLRALVLVVLVLVLAGCSAPTGQHWPRSSGTESLVNLVVPLEAPSVVRAAADRAARDWTAAAGLRVRMINRAQPGQNNVELRYDPSLPAGHEVTRWSWDESLHIVAATIRTGASTTAPLTAPTVVDRNAVCHGLGHALGLVHGSGPGPCEAGHPTAWDLALIGEAYDHTDPSGPPGV